MAKKPPRRRLRLGLRGLMLLVLAFGLGFGWKARRASIQRRAVAEIKAAGGTVLFDYQVPANNATGTFFSPLPAHPVPAWLRTPFGDEYFQEAREVILHDSNPQLIRWSAEALEAVASLDRVNFIQVIDVPVDDVGFARLVAMPSLAHLTMLDGDVTDAGLAALESSPALESMKLRGKPGRITARGVALIARQPRIRFLSVVRASLTDPASIAPLALMTNLEDLRLHPSPEDDACLVHLRGLAAMRSLELQKTRLTDAGVDRLKGMSRLETLAADGSMLTDAGLLRLESEHPALKSVHLDPAPRSTDVRPAIAGKLRAFSGLNLAGTDVTDADIDRLGGLDFASLVIPGSGLTDAGLRALATFPRLKLIDVRGTKVTEAGLAAFRDAKPGTTVRSGPIEATP